jgi:hypothetical protein
MAGCAEIGIGLTGFGILFSFLGVIFFFDKGLLAMGNVSLSCFVCLHVLLLLHQTLGTGEILLRCVTNPLQLDVSPDSFYCRGDTYNWLEVNNFLLPKAPQLQGIHIICSRLLPSVGWVGCFGDAGGGLWLLCSFQWLLANSGGVSL